MQKLKTLYTFTFQRKVETPETVESTNEAGEKVVVTKKVTKEVPEDFAIIRPSRSLLDDGELYYNVTVSKGVQAGLMNAALLARRITNDGGVLSEPEKEEWANKFLERAKKEMEFQRLTAKVDRNETEQQEHDQLIKDIAILNREMQEFEIRQQSMFDTTAEARARTRTIFWWLLHLLHRKNEKGDWVPFFSGKTFEEKQDGYDELDSEDVYPIETDRLFYNGVVQHAMQATAFWYYGRAQNQESIAQALKEMSQ